MSQTKTKHSTCIVYKKSKKTDKLIVVGYLSRRDEEQGLDIKYDMKGYTIVSL